MGERALIRRARQLEIARKFIGHLNRDLVDAVIQCGLGDWAEGPALKETFGGRVPFLAVDPVPRYIHEAIKDGFPGVLLRAALWSESAGWFEFHDRRTRTSMLSEVDKNKKTIRARRLTLDHAVEEAHISFRHAFLWMDCEGSEHEILKAAKRTIYHTEYILCELKEQPKIDGWLSAKELTNIFEGLGFSLIVNIRGDGLFGRKR